jgi:Zn-dependent protease/predicted transcriptional regulator
MGQSGGCRDHARRRDVRWSLKIAQIGATSLYIHVTFFLLIAWIAFSGWQQGGVEAAVDGVVFVLLIFLCVVLHEYGHVAAAAYYGIRTPSITLLPIGGLASLERMPEKPVRELVVALAGPAVNVVIFAVLLVVLGARFDFSQIGQIEQASVSLSGRLAAVNLILVLFNLIPAFPLDGGRVLRALLSMRFDRARATLYAARIGQAFAVVFAIVGLYGNPLLLLIAVFLFFAAEAEAGQERMRVQVSGYRARDAMITRYESLSPDSTAEDAGRLLLRTTQQEFPVIAPGGRLAGMVTRRDLIDAIRRSGAATPVSEFMVADLVAVTEDEPLESVMAKMSKSATRAVAVNNRARGFVGYINAENATELYMLSTASRHGGG